MIYTVYVVLVIVSFLVVLNGFFRGAKKSQIDAVLSLMLMGLIVIAFFVAGWKLGLLAIVIAFTSAILIHLLAAQLASRLFAVSSDCGSGFVGLPPRSLQRISQELAKPFDPNKVREELFSSSDQRDVVENELFDYCEHKPEIKALLIEFKVSRQDLQELYRQLIMVGAGQWACGHWVAASALAYPEALRYLLMRRKENIQETAFNLVMYFESGAALETSRS